MARKVIDAKIAVPFATLRAMAEVYNAKAAPPAALLVLESFSRRWFTVEKAAGGFLCPACGNLWTSPDKRDVCNHVGGSPSPATEATLRRWMNA